jgi:tripartite-type tricarboxylate transporter receptor subunit TctC
MSAVDMPYSIGLMLRSPPCPQGEVGVSKHVAAPSFETPAFRRAPQDEGGGALAGSAHRAYRKIGHLIFLALGLLAFASNTLAQQPGRPITIIVPYSPGTGIDILARALGNELSQKWGQPVVVDNKTGASGNIGTGFAARAAPDGNTLLMIAKVFVVNPSVFKSVPYDPITSFTPVIKLATGSIVLAVHPSIPADTAKGFIEYAKARPGQINYGSPGFATPHHLAMELFKQATGTDLVHVPYKGTSNVMSDLVGNHVGAMFIPTHVALPHAVDKQIKLLGVASLERVPAAPDVPTLDEQGVSGFEVDLWFGLLAPAGTPADIVNRYSATLNEFLRSPKMVAELAKQGLIASGGTPDALRELIAHDFAKWAKIIKDAGITAE